MDDVTRLQADVLRVLANPHRLDILHVLARGPHDVGMIAETIGISQPNASQHLAVLRSAGLVEAERHGRESRYRLTDPDVIVACRVMHSVLLRRLGRLAHLAGAPGGDHRPSAARIANPATHFSLLRSP
jgi:DNA-binding transcriptional ArsR family regulator